MNIRMITLLGAALAGILTATHTGHAQQGPNFKTINGLPHHKTAPKPGKSGTLKKGWNHGRLEKGDHVFPKNGRFAGSHWDHWTLDAKRGVNHWLMLFTDDYEGVLIITDSRKNVIAVKRCGNQSFVLPKQAVNSVDGADVPFGKMKSYFTGSLTYTAPANETIHIYVSTYAAGRHCQYKLVLDEL